MDRQVCFQPPFPVGRFSATNAKNITWEPYTGISVLSSEMPARSVGSWRPSCGTGSEYLIQTGKASILNTRFSNSFLNFSSFCVLGSPAFDQGGQSLVQHPNTSVTVERFVNNTWARYTLSYCGEDGQWIGNVCDSDACI